MPAPRRPQAATLREARSQQAARNNRSFTPSQDPYGFESPIPARRAPVDEELDESCSHDVTAGGFATPGSGISDDFIEPAPSPFNLHNTRARNSTATLVSCASDEFYGVNTAMNESRPGTAMSMVGPLKRPTTRDGTNREAYHRMSRAYNDSIINERVPLERHASSVSNRISRIVSASKPASVFEEMQDEKKKPAFRSKKTKRFWFIFYSLMTVTALTAIDMSIISTSLPTIVKELPRSTIPASWITSAFLLTTTAFQPFMGGLSDVLGRRNALVAAIILFIAGSIVCALANDMLTLVAGRGLQGVGGGGIQAIAEIVLSDLTTLRERGIYVGLISLVFAVATFIAPVLGGIFSASNWRWIFWINLPIGGVALAMIIPAMKLHTPPMPVKEKIHRMDIPANLILFGSVVALLLAVTEGGIEHPWTSPRIIISLLAGIAGLCLFAAVEFIPNRLSPDPVLPLRLFSNVTAGTCFFMTFIHGIITYGAQYILPIYFQGVKGANPLKSAIDIFPVTAPGPIAAILAGVIMAITGKYKIQITIWWATMILGVCLLLTWKVDTPIWQWVIIQLIPGWGVGALFALTLPPIQSSLPVSELAHATATFAFCRSLGSVFGIALTTTVFVATVNPKLAALEGTAAVGLRGATALEFATELHHLPGGLEAPARQAYSEALFWSFIVLIPFCVIGFIASFFVKELPLPDFQESSHGIVDPNAKAGQAEIQNLQAQAEAGLVVVEKVPKKSKNGAHSRGEVKRSMSDSGSPTATSATVSLDDDHYGDGSKPQSKSYHSSNYHTANEPHTRMSNTEAYKKASRALADAPRPRDNRAARRRSSRLNLYGSEAVDAPPASTPRSVNEWERMRADPRMSVANPDGTWLGSSRNSPAVDFFDDDEGEGEDFETVNEYDWRQGYRGQTHDSYHEEYRAPRSQPRHDPHSRVSRR